MAEPTLIAPRTGEIIGDAPDRRVEILCDHDTIHATWSRFAPGRDGADAHIHRRHTDIFYVLAGELTVKLGPAGEAIVPAGQLARLPPMVVHGFRNGGDEELRHLNLHAPATGFADYMRALRDGREPSFDQEPPPASGARPATDAVIGGAELLADRPGLAVALVTDIDAVAISETRAEPDGGPPPPVHVHDHHSESFYVLEGEVAVTAGDRDLRAGAGAWLTVPPGVAHTLSFPGDTPVAFLNVHAPNCGFGRFLRTWYVDGHDPATAVTLAGFDERVAT